MKPERHQAGTDSERRIAIVVETLVEDRRVRQVRPGQQESDPRLAEPLPGQSVEGDGADGDEQALEGHQRRDLRPNTVELRQNGDAQGREVNHPPDRRPLEVVRFEPRADPEVRQVAARRVVERRVVKRAEIERPGGAEGHVLHPVHGGREHDEQHDAGQDQDEATPLVPPPRRAPPAWRSGGVAHQDKGRGIGPTIRARSGARGDVAVRGAPLTGFAGSGHVFVRPRRC